MTVDEFERKYNTEQNPELGYPHIKVLWNNHRFYSIYNVSMSDILKIVSYNMLRDLNKLPPEDRAFLTLKYSEYLV